MSYFDDHIHFCIDGKEITVDQTDIIIKAYISKGIFHLRDMGHKNGIGLKAKKFFKDIINIETAGYAVYKKGGYGSFLGVSVAEKTEIKERIDYLYNQGVDFIKVINSGIVTTNPKHPVSKGGFDIEELKIIVSEATARGLKVFCHANGDDNIKNAIIAGVSSIEHGFFIKKETIYLLKEYGVQWTPTVNALKSIVKFIPIDDKAYINGIVEKHLEMVKFASALGVKIGIGSDSGSKGNAHGEAFFEEMRLLSSIGISI